MCIKCLNKLLISLGLLFLAMAFMTFAISLYFIYNGSHTASDINDCYKATLGLSCVSAINFFVVAAIRIARMFTSKGKSCSK